MQLALAAQPVFSLPVPFAMGILPCHLLTCSSCPHVVSLVWVASYRGILWMWLPLAFLFPSPFPLLPLSLRVSLLVLSWFSGSAPILVQMHIQQNMKECLCVPMNVGTRVPFSPPRLSLQLLDTFFILFSVLSGCLSLCPLCPFLSACSLSLSLFLFPPPSWL